MSPATVNIPRVPVRIPEPLAAKADSFPESSYGATTVTLILSDGRRIKDVILSAAGIVRVKGRAVSDERDLDFRPSDIVDVESQHKRKRLPRLRLLFSLLFRRDT
jgi:hypothetical protein